MNRPLLRLLWTLLAAPALTAAEPPRFGEVIDLVRSNLAGISAGELNDAVIGGLLERLHPRVLLLTNGVDAATDTNPPPPLIARTNLFDSRYLHCRVGRVEAGLAGALQEALAAAAASNTLQGVIIDLRFAGGGDFAEAGRAADLFVAEAQPLLSWGGERFTATAKTNTDIAPLALVVNRETRGAAEALAAALQAARAGVVIGAPTAGEAALFRELPLSTGQRLRVAVAPVEVGPAAKPVPASGVQPDIAVSTPAAEERRFLDDPFRATATSTARAAAARAPRLTEADLVRLHQSGQAPGPGRSRRSDPPPPQVTDPALVRALDLLKGLALLEPRSP